MTTVAITCSRDSGLHDGRSGGNPIVSAEVLDRIINEVDHVNRCSMIDL